MTLYRKYDKGTLVHITDEMFEWFLKLEQERVNLLSSESLASHKENLVEKTLSSILGNNHLLGQWKALFTVNESFMPSTNGPALVLHLFNEVVTRYVKMRVGEFLREFRRDFKLQKTEAHWKKVVEKKKKKNLVSSKVTVESIQQESIFQSNVYSKSELQFLCKAYGLVSRRSDSKALLSERLVPKIRESQYVLHPQTLENPSQQPGPSTQTETTVSENMATNETGPQPGTVISTVSNN